jgi:hypothetical protein
MKTETDNPSAFREAAFLAGGDLPWHSRAPASKARKGTVLCAILSTRSACRPRRQSFRYNPFWKDRLSASLLPPAGWWTKVYRSAVFAAPFQRREADFSSRRPGNVSGKPGRRFRVELPPSHTSGAPHPQQRRANARQDREGRHGLSGIDALHDIRGVRLSELPCGVAGLRDGRIAWMFPSKSLIEAGCYPGKGQVGGVRRRR